MTDPNWAEWINPFGPEFLPGGGTARVGGGTAQRLNLRALPNGATAPDKRWHRLEA